MPSDLREELVKVTMVKDEDEGVTLELKIDKVLFIKMFGSWDFQKEVERMVCKKLVDNLPIEKMNEILNKIDTNSIAKAVALDLINKTAGERRSY